jgi:hypothetical protein
LRKLEQQANIKQQGPSIAAPATIVVHRERLAEWIDPFTLPQTRINESGRLQKKVMKVEGFLVFKGPANPTIEVENAVKKCIEAAAAAAAAALLVGWATGGAAALTAATTSFKTCLGAEMSAVVSEYSITIETPSRWSDWSDM